MYRLFSAAASVALTFQFSAHAKSLEFVPEKRKPAAKHRVAKTVKKAAYADFPEVMSYHDLMSLAPYKRVAYIRGIRAMLVELSQRARLGQGTLVADGGGIEALMHPESVAESEFKYRALLDLFDALIPRAQAEVKYDLQFSGIQGRRCTTANRNETKLVLGSNNEAVCFPTTQYNAYRADKSNPQPLYRLSNEFKDYQRGQTQAVQANSDMKAMVDAKRYARGQIQNQAYQKIQKRELDEQEKIAAAERKNMDDHNTAVEAYNAGQAQDAQAKKDLAAMQDHQIATDAYLAGQEQEDQAKKERLAMEDQKISQEAYEAGQAQKAQADVDKMAMQDAGKYAEQSLAEQTEEARKRTPHVAAGPASTFDDVLKKREAADQKERDTQVAEAQQRRRDQEQAEFEKKGATEIDKQMAENRKQEGGDSVGNGQIAGADTNKAGAPGSATPMTMQSAVENLPPSTPEVCKKTLLKCEAKLAKKLDAKGLKSYGEERSKSLQTFRDKSPSACISSGNMSAYTNAEVKAGNCKVVSTFCYNPEDERCTEKGKYQAGSSRKEREAGKSSGETPKDGKVFTCKKGALCNPLVFGAMKDGSGICVQAGGSDLTVACNREVEAMIEKKKKGDKVAGNYEQDILKNGASGVANAWDDWRDAFNKMCRGDSVSQSAHCEECTVIGKRLRDLHRLADGSCDSAKKFTELPGSTTSETTR
jgi:hypothetical protein